jgi:hypothetical protein
MGHDFITYEGDHELFNDFDLWTLRHFFLAEALAMEASQATDDMTALRLFVEQWDWLGPGVFTGTDLSDYVSERRTRWELLLQLLQRAGDRIAGFGESVPLDYLTAHVSTPSAYFTQAQPTRLYLICIGRICTLLSKHEPQAA